MTAEPQREWKSRPSGRSPDPREDGSPQTDGSFVGLPGPSPCATCPLTGNASGEPGMAPPRRPLPSLPRSTQHLRETRRPTGTRAEEAAWWGGSPGSPGPNDGLAGIPGARVVCAVEVEPQQDLAPPLGLGVQDLDTGSHPGQRCIGARPAGQSRSGLQQQAKASGSPLQPPDWGRDLRARGSGAAVGVPRSLPARHVSASAGSSSGSRRPRPRPEAPRGSDPHPEEHCLLGNKAGPAPTTAFQSPGPGGVARHPRMHSHGGWPPPSVTCS